MKIIKFIVLTFIITTIFIACSRRPRSILTEEKMCEVIYDMEIINAITVHDTKNFRVAEEKESLVKSVLHKHSISIAQFDSSLVWYADNIKQYQDIKDTVSARVTRRYDYMVAMRPNIGRWLTTKYGLKIPSFFILHQNHPTFKFDIDTLVTKQLEKDKFNFRFTPLTLSSKDTLETKLYFNYKDTIVIENLLVTENREYQIDKPQLPDSLLMSVSGYVRIKHKDKASSSIILNNIRNKSVNTLSAPTKEGEDVAYSFGLEKAN